MSDTALAEGRPFATGPIEGACRRLIGDRLEITGARWGLSGAEAVLRLRAVRDNGDLDAYEGPGEPLWTLRVREVDQAYWLPATASPAA